VFSVRTGRFYPAGNILGVHFCLRLSRPQNYSAAGRIMPMKNPSDTIGNRTPALPDCSVMSHLASPPRVPCYIIYYILIRIYIIFIFV
jgi:hypothetical protein